jgi:hypothetical protein
MPCCGQKRAALKAKRAPAPGPTVVERPPSPAAPPRLSPAPPPPAAVVVAGGDVPIEYLERSRIRVRGPATGRVYEFSGDARVQAVDLRDAAGLLGTRFFRRRGA